MGFDGKTSDEVVHRAAALNRIDQEIEAFPDGYSYDVGERVANLSGGQRQRIALARVFLQDPPIIVLDEVTSAMAEIMKGRTVIMNAHRLSSLRRADRVLVFRSELIVEDGTFPELLANPDSEFGEITNATASVNGLDV